MTVNGNILLNHILDKQINGLPFKLHRTLQKKSQKSILVDVLNAFIKMNSEKVLNEDQVLKCLLFYNNNIKVGGTHIYYTNWYKKRYQIH